VITSADIERFTEGDCHIMAWAIHKETGWPIYTFWDGDEHWMHAFVKMPNGKIIDVEGVTTLRTFKKKWSKYGNDPIKRIEWKDLRESWGGPSYGNYSYSRAKKIARYLLAELEVA
jgi:hypothetical protein